ncbi:MAG TPA: sugar kinase, partial [Bacillota bacterium]
MARTEDVKIILVKRNTRLEDLVSRYNTVSQVKFYIEHLGADFSDYQTEDNKYKQVVAETERILEGFG